MHPQRRRNYTCVICGEPAKGGQQWLEVPQLKFVNGTGPGRVTEFYTHHGECTQEAYRRLGWIDQPPADQRDLEQMTLPGM